MAMQGDTLVTGGRGAQNAVCVWTLTTHVVEDWDYHRILSEDKQNNERELGDSDGGGEDININNNNNNIRDNILEDNEERAQNKVNKREPHSYPSTLNQNIQNTHTNSLSNNNTQKCKIVSSEENSHSRTGKFLFSWTHPHNSSSSLFSSSSSSSSDISSLIGHSLPRPPHKSERNMKNKNNALNKRKGNHRKQTKENEYTPHFRILREQMEQ